MDGNGSDIGGSWKSGTPTRSLYHFDLLVMLCREYGFHLCQEHYWWNPAKLPTPAEWVNVRRVRVKDAVNCIWWLSLTPWPKANNRRMRALYSDSMLNLLQKRLRTDALQGHRAFLALQEISGTSGRHAYRSGNRIASGVQANRRMLSCRLL
jgi:hypothetical protein